ncbi:hypothetical protein JCM11491_001921 [Sporobolomyces phaffii]
MSLLVVSASDVAEVTRDLTATALCDMLGSTMHTVSKFTVEQGIVASVQNPQRITTESSLHKTLYMPSRLTNPIQGPATSIKVVASPKPECSAPGLPATTLLMDEETGRVQAIVNAAELTGLRTAAASALATTILADPAAEKLVIFGSGTQAFYHARLILELFPSIKTVRFIVRQKTSRTNDLLSRILSRFPQLDLDAIRQEDASDAVKLADIICTCVPSTAPLFSEDDLKARVHINAIGSYTPTMFEFPPTLISASSSGDDGTSSRIPTILVDSRAACLHEAGELIAAGIELEDLIEIGELCDERGQLKADTETAAKVDRLRRGSRKQTLFKCVGVGSMDVAVTRLVVEAARKRGLGTLVDF